MQKIINFRPLLIVFLSLILGLLAGNLYLGFNAFLIVDLVAFLLFMGILFIKPVKNKLFKGAKLDKVIIILFLVFYIFGALSFVFSASNFNDYEFAPGVYNVSGYVKSVSTYENNKVTVELKNVTVTADDISTDINKNLILQINYYDSDSLNLLEGYKVSFEDEINFRSILEDNEINGYVFSSNANYYANTIQDQVTVTEHSQNLAQQIRQNVKEMLFKNLSYENASIAYAVLFADKTFITGTLSSDFATSGIIHMLAISGLHIGFLILLLSFVLSKLKVNRYINFGVIFAVLLAYSYMCGFVPSVVRASIMALTLLFSRIIGERNDNLSSLSFAGILILLISPLSLFSLGFILSFASVFAIFLLYEPINKALNKIKLPSMLSAPIALTVSAQLGALPFIATYFNEISLLGVFTNLLALPLFAVGYIVLLLAVLFVSITSIFSFMFYVPNLMFSLVTTIGKRIADISFSSISMFGFSFVAVVLYFGLMFSASKYVMLNKTKKLVTMGVVFVLICLSLVVSNLPASFNEFSLYKIKNVENATVITTENNNIYLVNIGSGDSWDLKNITEFLNEQKINQLEAIILTEYNDTKQLTLINLIEEYNVQNLYIPHSEDNVMLFALSTYLPANVNLELMENNNYIMYNEVTFTSHSIDDSGYALSLIVNNASILYGESEYFNSNENDAFDTLLDVGYNIVVTKTFSGGLEEIADAPDLILTEYYWGNSKPDNLYTTYEEGSLQVKLHYDTMDVVKGVWLEICRT